ncbi:MAG: hypothetical protein ABIN89_28205 [Chitinophagaceae bacterium]
MSKSQTSKKLVPKQEKGSKSDTAHSVTLKTIKEAKELYSMAKNRLLDISHWDKLCGPVSGTFHLMDNRGNQSERLAIQGDYLKIDVPGPGSKTGDGFDWVKIESIEEDRANADHEEIAIKVRPTHNPRSIKNETAHFFKEDSTSTFIVRRDKNMLIAEVHGRNELANINPNKPLDAVRNTLMALSAMLGLSSTQWKKLVKGLLSMKKLR